MRNFLTQYCQAQSLCNSPNIDRFAMQLYLSKEFEDWQTKDPFKTANQLQGKVYRELEARKTLQFTHQNASYFAKLHYGVGWREIIKNILQFRLPILGAKNEWLALKKLQQLNIASMTPVAYGLKGINPAKYKSFLITKALKNTISLEDLCKNWPETPPDYGFKRQLIQKIAHISRVLHTNGINHRDYYICHFLLDENALAKHKQLILYLIDLHRAQLRSKTPFRWQVKDIGSLYFSSLDIGLSQRDILRFMVYYTGSNLKQTLQNDKQFWTAVENRAIDLYKKAFNKKPKLPLKISA